MKNSVVGADSVVNSLMRQIAGKQVCDPIQLFMANVYSKTCLKRSPGPLVEPLKPLETFNLVAIL